MYWSRSFKDAKSNIQKNSDFFEMCQGIGSVIVMGHSLSEVDLPYFQEIKRRLSLDAYWRVSFHSPADRDRHEAALNSLGIEQSHFQHFQMESL